jgi:short-subunit dehydrogenase
VINVSSASGFWPVADVPDYSASKAAVLAFSRAVGKMADRTNVRVVALCPAFADTVMGQSAHEANPSMVLHVGGLMTAEFVAESMLQCIMDRGNSGKAMLVTKRGFVYYGDKKAKL